jgi:hypothetical protein
MADTGPEDVEKRALLAFLEAQREIVLAIVAGLAQDALRTPVLPSSWTPLGLPSISDSPSGTGSSAWLLAWWASCRGPAYRTRRRAVNRSRPGYLPTSCSASTGTSVSAPMPSWLRRRCRRRCVAGTR